MAKSGGMSGFVVRPAVLLGHRAAVWLGNNRVAVRPSALVGKTFHEVLEISRGKANVASSELVDRLPIFEFGTPPALPSSLPIY